MNDVVVVWFFVPSYLCFMIVRSCPGVFFRFGIYQSLFSRSGTRTTIFSFHCCSVYAREDEDVMWMLRDVLLNHNAGALARVYIV